MASFEGFEALTDERINSNAHTTKKMGELGLNDQHVKMMQNYLEFAHQQRECHLRSIDYLFQDVVDTRLLETSYTVDEVTELLAGLRAVVAGEARDGLAGAAHAQILLLQQLCAQAERWHLTLVANFSELENRSLLEGIRQLDEKTSSEITATCSNIKLRDYEPADDGPIILLHREIKRLSTIAAEQRDAMNALEEQVVTERTSRQLAEKNLHSLEQELTNKFEAKVRQLEANLAHNTNIQSISIELQKPQNDDLKTKSDEDQELRLKDELKQALARLTLAEKELQCKLNQSTTFNNLRRMLDSKNEQLRTLRAQLAMLQDPNTASSVIAEKEED